MHRLAANEETSGAKGMVNLELTHCDFTVAEVSRVKVSADGTLKTRASNYSARVPILTNPEALANGGELLWRGASWVKVPPAKKLKPLMLKKA